MSATVAYVTSVCVPRLDFALNLGSFLSGAVVEKLSRQALFVSYNQQSSLSVHYDVVQLRDA